jgi:hypothetical protein
MVFRTRCKYIPVNIPPVVFNMNKISTLQCPDKIFTIERVHKNLTSNGNKSYRLLGVQFDEFLSFDKHVDILGAKPTRANYFLK